MAGSHIRPDVDPLSEGDAIGLPGNTRSSHMAPYWSGDALDSHFSGRRLGFARADPVAILTAYTALLMFVPSTLILAPLGGAGSPALVACILITVWYIVSWIAGAVVPSGGGRPVRIAMFAFAVAVLASFIAGMLRGITQVEVLSAERGLINVGAWSGLVIVVTQSLTSYEQLDKLMRRLVAFGSIVALVGIFEFFMKIDVASYIDIPGLSINSEIATLTRSSFARPTSTASQPIELSVVMAMLLPFALQQASDKAHGSRLSRWLPPALIGAVIPLTVSRSGIVGVAVAALFLVPTWSAKRRFAFLAGCGGAILALNVLAPGLVGTFLAYFDGIFGSTGSTSLVTRTSDYARDWPYIVQSPIFGRGFATFLPQIYSYTDNSYLHQMLECGIIGVSAMVGIYLAAMHCGAAGRRVTSDPTRREFGQSVVASVAVALVASATFDSLNFPMFTGVLFLVLGVAGAYLGIMRTDASSTNSTRTFCRPD